MINTFECVYISSHQNIKYLVEIISYGVNRQKVSPSYMITQVHVNEQ